MAWPGISAEPDRAPAGQRRILPGRGEGAGRGSAEPGMAEDGVPFDPELLRALLPYGVYERGRAYFRKRRVKEAGARHGVIRGRVEGSEGDLYEVEIRWTGRELLSACSCPYDGPVCKHAVALALWAWHRLGPRAFAAGEAPAFAATAGGEGRGSAGARAAAGNGRSPAGARPPAVGRGGGGVGGRPREEPASRSGSPAKPAAEEPPWQHWLELALQPDAPEPPRTGTVQVLCRVYLGREGLEVAFLKARLGRSGLGREQPLPVGPAGEGLPPSATPQHRLLVRLLGQTSPWPLWGYLNHRFRVPSELLDACLELLGQLPFVFREDGREPLRVARRPLQGQLVLEEEPEGGLRLALELRDLSGEPWRAPAGSLLLAGRRYLWLWAGAEVYPVLMEGDPRLALVAGGGRVRVPPAEADAFIAGYLPRLQEQASVRLAPSLAARIADDLAPRPVLLLEEEGGELVVDLRFAYGEGPPAVRAGDPEPELVPAGTDARPRWARRQRAAEQAAAERLAAAGLAAGPDGRYRLAGEAALDFLAEVLPRLGREWEVYGAERLARLKVARAPVRTRVRISSGIDWFDVELEVEGPEGRAGTAEVLEALRSGSRYVRLDSGLLARLPEGWRQRAAAALAALAGPGEPMAAPGRALRLRRWDVGVAAELAAAADLRQEDAAFRSLASLAAGFAGIPSAPLPRGLRAELRPYQRRGYDWLCFLRDHGLHGVLADEMGLGKTVQALALLLAEKEQGRAQAPSLAVVPTSLVFNWLEEARRFAPDLRVLALTGPDRRRRLPELDRCDLALTTYALVRRDLPLLAGREFHYLILDEAQHAKNAETQTARAVKALRARHRLALTGTPLENRLSELWALFDFLMPGFLGSREQFLARYVRPVEAGGGQAQERLQALRRRVYPFILRRVKEDVAWDLPPRTEAVLTCQLLPGQRRLYREVLAACRERVFAEVESRGLERSRIVVLDALLKLRQICCHPALLGIPAARGLSSAKLELFRELVGEIVAGGRRVLVFSQFVAMLQILREELQRLGIAYEYLDGRTRDREVRVRRFQEREDIPVFLISLRAGGTGLNLTGASYVIHYDAWWNPAVEEQATGRAHRIGQRQPVFSYKLVTRGTVEEKILELQRRKQALVDALLVADRSAGKKLTREDLELLFALD